MKIQEKFAIEVFKSVDTKDAEGFANFFTEQGAFTFGNGEAIIGRANIATAVTGFLGAVEALTHDITGVWVEENITIVRALVTYTRKDGNVVKLPCCNVWKMAGQKFSDYQIFMDVSPVFA